MDDYMETTWDIDLSELARLTLGEFTYVAKTPIKVMSARDGKILANPYNKNNPKHKKLAGYTVAAVWADVAVRHDAFSPAVRLGLSVYVREE